MTLLSEVVKEEIFLQAAERRGMQVSQKDIESEDEKLLAIAAWLEHRLATKP